MDILIFSFGLVVTIVVGIALTLGIVSHNRAIERGANEGKPATGDSRSTH